MQINFHFIVFAGKKIEHKRYRDIWACAYEKVRTPNKLFAVGLVKSVAWVWCWAFFLPSRMPMLSGSA